MINVLTANPDGKKILFVGLTRENCERLLDNQPIRITGSKLGLEVDIYIIADENIEEVKDSLRSLGVPLPREEPA